MAQLSRPYQIALLAVALAAAVLLLARHGPSSSTSGSGSSPAASSAVPASSAPAKAATAQGSSRSASEKAAAPSPVYHGSLPGVEGLTRAIAKAHGAVATSQQNAKQLEEKSAQASGPAAQASGPAAQASSPAAPASTVASARAGTVTSAAPAAAPAATTHKPSNTPSTASHASTTSPQRTVETELAQGNVVVLLFWNPNGADDVAVRNELQLLAKVHRRPQPLANVPSVQALLNVFGVELDKKIAVHEAPASQVASFGSITRGVQVYGTPTLLIVNKQGRTITLTGLQDAYAIEQAIEEARQL